MSNGNLFAGTYGGLVFRTNDSGTSWAGVNISTACYDVYGFVASGQNLFAGTDFGGVFRSTDNGISWTAVNSGLPINSSGLPTVFIVHSFAVSSSNLFAGTSDGIFLSTNDGTSWTAVDSGLTNTSITALISSGTNLFVGTAGGGVFLSTNNGESWIGVSSGLPKYPPQYWLESQTYRSISALAVSDTNLFAGVDGGGVFLSTNNGTNWTQADSGLTNTYVIALAVNGTDLFAGTPGGVFLSTNKGIRWSVADSGLTNTFIQALAVSGTNLFAGTQGGGVWKRPLSEMITSVKKTESGITSTFSLSQNYPNPCNPSTVISYQLPVNTLVTLKVYDELGRLVRTLVEDRETTGTHSVTFNASSLSSGVYFYRLTAGSFVQTKKLMLIK